MPRRLLHHRGAVTLVALVVAVGLSFVPLPGYGPEAAADPRLVPQLSLGAIGLAPVFLAAVLVEFFALAHPKWRLRRISGRVARAPLRRATAVLGIGLALLQAYHLWNWAASWGFLAGAREEPSGPLFVTSLVGATGLLILLAEAITRHGRGNGYSLIIGAGIALDVVATLHETLQTQADRAEAIPWLFIAAIAAGLVYLAIVVLRRRPAPGRELPIFVQAPSSGLEPVTIAAAVYHLALIGGYAFGFSVLERPGGPLLGAEHYWDIFVPVALISAAGLTAIFYRNTAVTDVWHTYASERGMKLSRDSVALRVAEARWRALLWTVPLVFGIAIADSYIVDHTGVSALGIVVLTAVALDVIEAWRFAAKHGALESVEEVHRLYVVPIVLDALAQAEIPVHARGIHHRTLLQFFGPLVAVEILVPEAHAEQAREVAASIVG